MGAIDKYCYYGAESSLQSILRNAYKNKPVIDADYKDITEKGSVMTLEDKIDAAMDMEFIHGDYDDKITPRLLFQDLLLKLWKEEECFSGKRPLGNSDWQAWVYSALVEQDFLPGTKQEEDLSYPDNDEEAEKFVLRMINRCFEQ